MTRSNTSIMLTERNMPCVPAVNNACEYTFVGVRVCLFLLHILHRVCTHAAQIWRIWPESINLSGVVFGCAGERRKTKCVDVLFVYNMCVSVCSCPETVIKLPHSNCHICGRALYFGHRTLLPDSVIFCRCSHHIACDGHGRVIMGIVV